MSGIIQQIEEQAEGIGDRLAKKNDRQLFMLSLVFLIALLLFGTIFFVRSNVTLTNQFIDSTQRMTDAVSKNTDIMRDTRDALKENSEIINRFRPPKYSLNSELRKDSHDARLDEPVVR